MGSANWVQIAAVDTEVAVGIDGGVVAGRPAAVEPAVAIRASPPVPATLVGKTAADHLVAAASASNVADTLLVQPLPVNEHHC